MVRRQARTGSTLEVSQPSIQAQDLREIALPRAEELQPLARVDTFLQSLEIV